MHRLFGSFFLFFSLIAATSSCSSGSKFEIDGQLLNMNQGIIYVYSSSGLISNIDTIKVVGGRFTYNREISQEGTLVLVFPNFSEVPVFAAPGEDVTLKGNAQQLTHITISGTDENELMTEFRIDAANKSPNETEKLAEDFIKKHPESQAAVWALEKHLILKSKADLKKALALAKEIRKVQKDNGKLTQLILELEKRKFDLIGKPLPQFSIVDVNGKVVNNETIKGKKTIIYTAASWDYSNDFDRNIKSKITPITADFQAVRINLDASKSMAKNEAKYIDKNITIVCDEKLFKSPLLKLFGLYSMGDNVVVDANGKVIAHNILPSEI